MQKKFYALLALVLLATSAALAQSNSGTLKGKVFDRDTKEPLPFVTVIVFLNGNTVNGSTTDIDGEYTVKPLEPGVYDVSFQFVGYQPQTVKGVVIRNGKITDQNAEMLAGVELNTVEVFDYKVPLIDKDGGSSGGTITREDFKNMPSRSVSGIASTVAGATDTGSGISIRGAREGSTWIYIDGIKVRGSSSLPKSAVEQISVITGGIPANIGDATGGVINVSLRNASSNFTGGVEMISSGFASGNTAKGLDHYGYNLVEGSLSGPLVFKKNEKGEKERPILGFFISGNYTDVVDNDPQYGGVMKIKQATKESLLSNPIRPNLDASGQVTGVLYNADFLTKDDFEKTKTRLNVRNRSANLVTKFDFNLADNMTLTIGGTGAFSKGNDYNDVTDGARTNALMNWDNNQQNTNFDWRAYVKFSQRFKNADGEDAAASNLKNIYYSVMVDYSQNYGRSQDATHGNDLFKYGHVGYYDILRGNTYEQIPGSYYKQTGFQDMNIFFTPSQFNPDLASITSQYFVGAQFFPTYATAVNQLYDANGNLIRDRNQIFLDNPGIINLISANPAATLNNITAANGLRNGDIPTETYGLWNYIGTQSNNYSVGTNNQFRVTGSGSADIGDHAIQLGFEFEQRKDAGYSVSPVGLWGLARLTANSHIEKVDNKGVGYDSTIVLRDGNYYVYYNTAVGVTNQSEFDYHLREKLGLNPRGGDYLNIDNMSPEFLSINMFNADELLNSGSQYVSYYGYDPHGNKISGRKPNIEDFFSQTYQVNGISYYKRAIGAFEPIYTSGYIMDKFAFDDLIFNVGVRVDRYDANQPVLKDPFVVSEAFTAGEVKTLGAHPSNIGDDFVVYVDDVNKPTTITGYRNGSTWYNSLGQLVTDPAALGGTQPLPYLKVAKDAPLAAGAFKDYKPAVNIMPRIAFSFPISDEATFFAHYDVLTQRPTEYSRFDPTDYLNMRFQNNPLINNSALKPERTVDYALGFQQVLSKTSSLKVEAFYRELRNMIQMRKFTGAYPIAYRAFDNIDFGTVKGLTLTYDMRRTGNIRLNASYTLQFADGTGSTSQSQSALINAGVPNLRSINPFNYDQRHRIVLTTDYRFGGGTDYNGPVIKDFQVLANTGFNFICNLGSGTPYTPQQFATPITGELSPSTEGSINGARLPWQFTVDFNADRNFTLQFGKEGEKKKSANLNVYLWVTNLLNTRNVKSVHRFTGVPDDDGYLASARAQQFIAQQNSPTSFANYYSMYANDPNRLGQPRQIRLGVRLDF